MTAPDNAIPLMTGARYVAQCIGAPERINRAIHEIESNLQIDPGVVFDHAKSLIETTCKTLLKERGYQSDENWKVHRLAEYTLNVVVQIPDGHPDPNAAKTRIQNTLRSLIGVVQGVGELRNMEGEIGHGKEADRITLTSCHAEFAARAADAVVKFLTESHRGNNGKQDEVVVYSENPSFNESIDELYGPFVVLAGSYQASEVLYQMDRQVYQDALTEYLQEPKAENE
jgi:hypothetical protein